MSSANDPAAPGPTSNDSTPTNPAVQHEHAVDTVEAVVRRQMAKSLGGRMGMIEAGIPGLVFTVLWLTTKDITLSLICGGVAVGLFALNRIVRKETLAYVGNAAFSMLLGWVFVRWAASSGGSEQDQALAYFLPGILWSGAYTIMLAISCFARWPMIGFLVGGDDEDPFRWRRDPQIVDLCVRLTWIFALPGAIGVLLQGPVWLLGKSDVLSAGAAVAIIAGLRLGLGWALRIGSWGSMIWLLARNHTPVTAAADADAVGADGAGADGATRPEGTSEG